MIHFGPFQAVSVTGISDPSIEYLFLRFGISQAQYSNENAVYATFAFTFSTRTHLALNTYEIQDVLLDQLSVGDTEIRVILPSMRAIDMTKHKFVEIIVNCEARDCRDY